jgi:phosphate-selective porin
MKSLRMWFVLLVSILGLARLTPPAQAQNERRADEGAPPAAAPPTRAEVEQLRKELAAQRQTIERLQTLVEQLAEVKSRAPAPATDGARLVNASLTLPATAAEAGTRAELPAEPYQKPAEKKEGATPLTAGWNGEHFFIKSADGQFQIQPYGYVQTDYRAYNGDGAPPDSFFLRRVRFGFQGNYGTHYSFSILADTAATSGAIIRDIFLTAKVNPSLQFQFGQFKEPFAQEELIAVPNIDFVERSFASLLYPAASTAFRSPGAMVFGDLFDARLQYWVSAFNGKGIATANTTNEPEVLGRLRLYPFKKSSNDLLKGLAIGGAVGHGRTRGLSNEPSFNGTLPDASYNFFPSFRLNGPVERYNGEFTWIKGPLAIRGEYDQLLQARNNVGSELPDGNDFLSVPPIVAKAWYATATYLLTGENRPENGVPKVKHPLFGPETPGSKGTAWGAWELKFRYEKIQAKALGANFPNPFTPAAVPTFQAHAERFVTGVNWYPNYWIRYMFDFAVDRQKDPSVQGILPQNYFVALQRIQFRF